MAVLPIHITGNPALHTPAAEVTEFDASLHELVSDMFETMAEAPGVGLAAPQVGVGLRVFVYSWVDDEERVWRNVAINPTLLITPTPTGEADEDDESEGCLSIPGERFALRRSDRAVLTALDLDGQLYEVDADGWLARIFQHEFDHLDGILYVDRLDSEYDRALAKIIKKKGWGAPGTTWLPGEDHLED